MSALLHNTTALVFGASGNVGHGAATAFLDAGATVIAPTRTAAGAEALRADFAGRDLRPLLGDISDPQDAPRLRDAILAAHGPVDHVLVSLGSWWQGGALAGQDPAAWTQVRRMLLDGHIHAAALFLPLLAGRPSASYTVVTGMGAHHHLPGTSLLFVATQGVLGLSRVLRDEHRDGPVRVNELLIGARIEKTPRPGVIPSATFGQAAVAIASHAEVRGQVLRYSDPATFPLSP